MKRSPASFCTIPRALLLASLWWGCVGPGLADTRPGVPLTETARFKADTLLSQGLFSEAIVEYRKALRIDKRDAAAHNRLGICYQKTARLKQARREYQRAVNQDPCYAEAWNNMGTLAHLGGKLKQAVDAYGKAIRCKPEDAAFHRNLAEAHLQWGRVTESVRAYTEAIRLDPSIVDASAATDMTFVSRTAARQYVAIARAYAQRGEPDTALQFLVKARKSGFQAFAQLRSDQAFADVVKDPRFAELLLAAR